MKSGLTLQIFNRKSDPTSVVSVSMCVYVGLVPDKKIIERMTSKIWISIFFYARAHICINKYWYISYMYCICTSTIYYMYIICIKYNYALFNAYQGLKLVEYQNMQIWVSWLEINFLFFSNLFDQLHININASYEIWPQNNKKPSEGSSGLLYYSNLFSLTF